FERAAALFTTDAPGQQHKVSWGIKAQVYEALGEVLTELGRYQEASQAYHHAVICLPAQEHLWYARLQRKTAMSWNHAATNPYDVLPVNVLQAFQEAEHILTSASD